MHDLMKRGWGYGLKKTICKSEAICQLVCVKYNISHGRTTNLQSKIWRYRYLISIIFTWFSWSPITLARICCLAHIYVQIRTSNTISLIVAGSRIGYTTRRCHYCSNWVHFNPIHVKICCDFHGSQYKGQISCSGISCSIKTYS